MNTFARSATLGKDPSGNLSNLPILSHKLLVDSIIEKLYTNRDNDEHVIF